MAVDNTCLGVMGFCHPANFSILSSMNLSIAHQQCLEQQDLARFPSRSYENKHDPSATTLPHILHPLSHHHHRLHLFLPALLPPNHQSDCVQNSTRMPRSNRSLSIP